MIYPLMLSLLAVAGAAASELPAMTEKIVARNPALGAAHERARQADAGRREVRASRWPHFVARGGVARGDDPVYAFGSLLQQGRFGPQNFAVPSLNNPDYLTHYQGALTGSVPVFTAFAWTSQSEIAEHGLRQATLMRDALAQELRYRIFSAYVQILTQRSILERIDARLASGRKAIQDADRLKDRGLVLGSDYFVAQAIHEALAGWRIQMENDLSQAQAQLNGLSAEDLTVPSERLPNDAGVLEPLRTWVDAALARRPDLQAARLAVGAAEASRREAAWSVGPRADAFASLETHTNDFSASPTHRLFGVRLQLPIGDPAYGPRKERAQADLKARSQDAAALEERIRIEVTQAHEAAQTARKTLPAARQTRDRAAQALELFRPLYRSGRQSVMEVLRAEEALARAEAAYVHAQGSCLLADARLALAAGRLDPAAIDALAGRLGVSP